MPPLITSSGMPPVRQDRDTPICPENERRFRAPGGTVYTTYAIGHTEGRHRTTCRWNAGWKNWMAPVPARRLFCFPAETAR
ncbi:hypothetical protein EVAR_66089_1 [Eumeta japonica]|uniref:Uncharacterized protein n=1 Tax=Eumeta variegata TaxID=151549 RepID=A0A4C1ZWS3_EUMVA|nr:hypothetical protein EVAR_66089_1 [Eumeta japonica]